MLTVNTNIGSIIATNQLNSLNRDYQNLQEQATTGKRINHAKDDAAGMAIVMGMTAEYKGNEMALRNIGQGNDLMSTQEGALGTVDTMFDRLKELAVNASNGTMSVPDRAKNNQEAQDIMLEIERVSQSTSYNGLKILDGSNATIDIQAGSGTSADNKITLTMYDSSLSGMSINGGDLTSVANAQTFLDNLVLDKESLSAGLATIGATNNRLEYASDNLKSMNKSLSASMSTIEDADMAKVSMDIAKNEVLQQLGYSMLGKANAQPGNYVNLFR